MADSMRWMEHLDKKQIAKIKQMVREGYSTIDIAKRFGIGRTRVTQICPRPGNTLREGMVKILIIAMLLSVASYASQSNVIYEWDANTETNLTNYTLFLSTQSLLSKTTAQAGLDPAVSKFNVSVPQTAILLSLQDCTTVYARLTATNNLNLQSEFSDEISTITRQNHPCKPGRPRVR